MAFEIGGVRGSGFFCDVMKAKNEYGETVALKQLKKEFVQNTDYIYRFKREIKLLQELEGCPTIVQCLDTEIDEANNIYRYTMPLADTNLYHLLKKYNNQISFHERVNIFDQILQGIRYAHERSILHRDIAPNNVLVFGEDPVRIRLSDFGLGKDHQSLSKFTKSVGSYGQLLYVAPEQYDNLKNSSVRSDIYSLGKLLYFVLTAKDPISIAQSIQFSSVIQKAIQEDPDHRFQSIEEFLEQYEKMKSLYLQVSELSPYETMDQYIKMKKDNIDWAEFHKIVLEAKVVDHVFYDYLQPIVDTLHDRDNLMQYKEFLNGELLDFLEHFNSSLHDCYAQTRWPFNYLNQFGYFFSFLYNNNTLPNEQLLCLKELWYIAIESDQWGPQADINKILRGGVHAENIAPFAEYLTESNSPHAYKILEKGNISEINPIIRNAISQIIERAKNR